MLEQFFGKNISEFGEKLGREIFQALEKQADTVLEGFAKELGYESAEKLKEDLLRYRQEGIKGARKILNVARNFESYYERYRQLASENLETASQVLNANEYRFKVDVKVRKKARKGGKYKTAAHLDFK